MKKIYIEQIDGVDVPEEFRNRFYDRRKHRGRVKQCSCGLQFYDETPRVTSKICLTCRINAIVSKHDVVPDLAQRNPRRHKHCYLCGSEFLDTSLACSRRYCSRCSAKYSYDMLEKLIIANGVHQNAKFQYLDHALIKVKSLYDGIKSDVQIARDAGLLASQVRYLRMKLGLSTISSDARRVASGKLSIETLDSEKIKEAIVNRLTYQELAKRYGVRPSTIKTRFRKSDIERSSLLHLPIDLSQRVIDIMIGHLLGDGCLVPVAMGKAAYFRVGHKIADREYTEWSADQVKCLQPIIHQQRKYVDGRLFDFISYTSIRTDTLCEWYPRFYDPSLRKKFGADGCKNPNINIFENLSELSLAIWYMDDGTYDSGFPSIAMYFPAADYDAICEALTCRFDVNFYHVKRKNIRLLKVRGTPARARFFEIVQPYIHPRMARKLPPVSRGATAYADDPLSTKFPTSKFREMPDEKQQTYLDEIVNFVVHSHSPQRMLDQPILEYLGDLQERLKTCLPKDGVLPFIQDGLTYLDAICPHRFSANHYRQPSFVMAWKDEVIVRKAVTSILSRDQALTNKLLARRIMEMVSAPGHFRPSGAAALLNTYRPKSVFDPFAGWCGRALACALNKYVKNYVGTDLQELTINAIRKILEDSQSLGVCKMQALCIDALQYMQKTDEHFDMILAGPPYYNVENYNGIVPTDSFADWQKNFVEPFAALSAKVLSNNGVLALHIFDTHQYSFIEPFMFSLEKAGLHHRTQYKFGTVKHLHRSQFIHIFGY